jgi:hypothetical protein
LRVQTGRDTVCELGSRIDLAVAIEDCVAMNP